jgi:hypothetical protein
MHLLQSVLALAVLGSMSCAAQPLDFPEDQMSSADHALQTRQIVEASLASSCVTLKKKTAGKSWRLYYAGSGFIRSDGYTLAQIGASVTQGALAENVCKVANDPVRSCSQGASSAGLRQFTLIWTEPNIDPSWDPNSIIGDGPWTCQLVSNDNSSVSLFNTPVTWADHVWAWTQD